MISKEEFTAHRQQFEAFVATVHRFAALLFGITFVGYGAAVWVWFEGATWTALIIATLSYLFFRQFRRLSVNLARVKLTPRPEAREMLLLVDQALDDHKPHQVLAHLEGQVGAARKQDQDASSRD
jgi:small-conductance mechanosensitive channel